MELAYLSKTLGIGGIIKKNPEDFLVEEISEDGTIFEIDKKIKKKKSVGDFTYFVLQKRNWDTTQALRAVSNKLHCSMKRFNYAGVKDRIAITTQLISGFKIDKKQLLNLRMKDIKLNGIWMGEGKIRIGDLLGNKFKIFIRNIEVNDAKARVKKIFDELNGIAPNYFGVQRFGSMRKNTHMVGRAIVNNNFKEAVWNYLTYTDGSELHDTATARKYLADTQNFGEALKIFPKYLKYERLMLNHLVKNPNDYVNSIRKLPRGLALMFVHSYQSHMFNKVLSKKISEGRISIERGDPMCSKGKFGFPDLNKLKKAKNRIETGRYLPVGRIVGYETTNLNDDEKEILEEEGISEKCFLIKSLPELSSKGALRCFFVSIGDMKFNYKDEGALFNFSLPAGAYATSIMREFIDRCK